MRNPVALLLALIAFAAGLYYGYRSADAGPPELRDATLLEPPRALAPFSLQTTRGTTLVNSALANRWTLVFFGFVDCPDICPTTLQLLSDARSAIGDQHPEITLPDIMLVSVDPDRDTLPRLTEYTAYFGEDVFGARVEEPALSEFTRDLGIVYTKVATSSDNYTMDHTGAVVLIGPDARLRAVFTPPLRRKNMETDLAAILGYLQ